MDQITVGQVIIIDGKAWTVARIIGAVAYAENDAGATIAFAAAEATVLGAGLWGLPGRIEPPRVNPAASVVASPAIASTET